MWKTMAVAILLLCPQGALANEADFLRALSGSWSGGGSYVRPNGDTPVTVTCNFKSTATASTLIMRGTCRALVVVSRSLDAELRVSGNDYSGRYSGPEGDATLRGVRSGNSLSLTINWHQTVRGDQQARMEISMEASNELTLRTTDMDAAGQRQIVTTDIRLHRDRP
jgi:hypothetical protein